MTIGAWVGVACGLLTLFITVATILVKVTSKFTTSVTELNVTMKGLGDKITDVNIDNKAEHGEIWDKVEKHDGEITSLKVDVGRLKDRAGSRQTTS